MPVDVQLAVGCDQLPECEDIAGWARAVWAAVEDGPLEPELCVRLTGAEEARELNRRYRGKDKPTNVLSFPADLNYAENHVATELLGDIVICVPVVVAEAAEQGKRFEHHLAHMVVHGVLHLYGYDHEKDARSRREMEALEREILGELDVSDPYVQI